jgi:hypothetical protein
MTNLLGANLNNYAAVGSQGEGSESPSKFLPHPRCNNSLMEKRA